MKTSVVGATGKVGRQVVAALRRRGADVRAAARQTAGVLDVEAATFDWEDPQTWRAALRGAESLFMVGPFALEAPGARVADLLAGAPALEKVVLLSSLAVAEPGDGSVNGEMEAAVVESGKEWTVLRSSWFDQNFTENPAFTIPIERRRQVIAALGDTPVSFVDTRDLGEVAAAALLGDGHGGVHEVTGPQAITLTEVADELTRATGRSITYPNPASAEVAEALTELGLPAPVVTVLGHVDEATRGGAFTLVSDTVERLLGRPARTFATFADEVAARELALPAGGG